MKLLRPDVRNFFDAVDSFEQADNVGYWSGMEQQDICSVMAFLSDILAKLTQGGINAIFKIQKGATRTATASPKLNSF